MSGVFACEMVLEAGALERLRGTWRQVEPVADLFALTLYRRLFERAPHLKGLFHTDIETQGRRVFDALSRAIGGLEEPKRVGPALEALGRRHRYAGVRPEHFVDLRVALFQTLEDLLGAALDGPAREAWTRFYDLVTAWMLRGLASVDEGAAGCDTARFFRPPA